MNGNLRLEKLFQQSTGICHSWFKSLAGNIFGFECIKKCLLLTISKNSLLFFALPSNKIFLVIVGVGVSFGLPAVVENSYEILQIVLIN